MKFLVDVHLHFPEEDQLGELVKAVHRLEEQGVKLMAQIDDLKAAIAEEDADIDQVLALVSSEVAQIADLQQKLADALANVAPDLTDLISDVQAHTAKLAAALPPAAPTT